MPNWRKKGCHLHSRPATFDAGFFASLLRFKARGRLPQGTRVSVLKSTPAVIIACHGSVPPHNDAADLFRSTSGDVPNVAEQLGDESCEGSNMGARLPADLFEGEFVIDNLLGVGIHFLTTMAKLQASDRAKVEVMLTDATVRIISDTFRQLSAVGHQQIYNDGRLNHRVDATSYPHEAAGVEEDKSPKATSNPGVVEPDPISPTGRWRYFHYLGYLGDFMRFFITDPVAGIAQLAQERAGKLHVHAGTDGTLLVRSVSDIVFERVSRISVPIEQKEYFHPDGNTVADYAKLPTTHLESWNFDPTKPWEAAYYLRDYARWLAQRHAYCPLPAGGQRLAPANHVLPYFHAKSHKGKLSIKKHPHFSRSFIRFVRPVRDVQSSKSRNS